jgi:hypothetical protein
LERGACPSLNDHVLSHKVQFLGPNVGGPKIGHCWCCCWPPLMTIIGMPTI